VKRLGGEGCGGLLKISASPYAIASAVLCFNGWLSYHLDAWSP